MNHRVGARQPPHAVRADERAARHRAERRADGAEHANQRHVERDGEDRHRQAEAQRRLRIARGAERAAQHEEHHETDDADEHRAEKRQRLRAHFGRGVDERQQPRRREPADDAQRRGESRRRQKGLIDDTIDLLRVARSRKARDEHGHAREHRADEDDDDENDLPADADRRVADEADVVAHHDVIDDALQPGDDVLQHRRPRELPHGGGNRPFDEGAIVAGSFDSVGSHQRPGGESTTR